MPGDDTNAYYALSVPACVVAIGAESWLARQKGLPITSLVRAIGSLSGGLGEVMVGLCLGPLLVGLYDWAFRTLAVVHWSDDSLIPWILAFFLGDFCYYLYHRAGHRAELGLTGVECITLHEERLLEEAPVAYKPVQAVIDAQVQAESIGVVAVMRPILTFKA
jgi:hypothetical protein